MRCWLLMEPRLSIVSERVLPCFLFSTSKIRKIMKRALGNQMDSPRKRIMITESLYGITEFLSNTPPINGIIKHKMIDFHVYEKTKSGILHLLNIESNSPKVKEKIEHLEITLEICLNVQKLVDGKINGAQVYDYLKNKTATEIKSEVIDGKQDRQNFHQIIREYLGTKLHTQTNADNTITLKRGKDRKKKERRGDSKQNPYCHFTLYKENKDTMESLNLISRLLKIQPKFLQFSGTKDKRAITTQRISCRNIDAERFKSLTGKINGIYLGDFKYENHGLSLADSLGNHFVITIRDLDGNEEDVLNAMQSLKTLGFINYFGMQRFGTRNISTHQVGIEMLAGNWQQACDLILAPKDDGNDY